jgi:hypothetical protein
VRTELGFLRKSDVVELCDEFPELEIRLKNFAKTGLKLSSKGARPGPARGLLSALRVFLS